MASNDIGIDLGTATVIIYDSKDGLLLKEPSVVAINTKSNKVIAVGEDANRMVGRTPDQIRAVMPLSDGVISSFEMTREMITYFIRKIYAGSLIKPRVAVCVPSGITGVESNAVVSAAISAGARKVYLIEEPVAAAIGAGLDISKPEGNLILDIGGGTSDVAVLSFNGIVCKRSVKTAGRKVDEAIIRYIRARYHLVIGEGMAERVKIEAASACFFPEEETEVEVKGHNMQTGLPGQITVKRSELCAAIQDTLTAIARAVRQTLEVTPPELSADIAERGLIMTGGGSLLHGLDRLLAKEIQLPVCLAPNPTECVAIGTAGAFGYLDQLTDGLIKSSTYMH